MAIDWGGIFGGAVQAYTASQTPDIMYAQMPQTPSLNQQLFGPTYIPPAPVGDNGVPPAKVTVDTRTGQVTTCKRRRRRKMLTEGDFNVLLRISTLPNNQNVRIALAKAIGRR